MIYLKQGVKLLGLDPQMAVALQVVHELYGDRGHSCWVTSGNDGQHKEGSLHYTGRALDFRLHNVPQHARPALVSRVKLALRAGEGEFEVYWEGQGIPYEYLHVEFDPKDRGVAG